jgi:cell division protein FtsL
MTSGAHWIVLGAILLAGVVALNVAVLQLNLRVDSLGEKRTKLRAENAALASEISSAAANAQIQSQASKELGLVPADPAETTYIQLGK